MERRADCRGTKLFARPNIRLLWPSIPSDDATHACPARQTPPIALTAAVILCSMLSRKCRRDGLVGVVVVAKADAWVLVRDVWGKIVRGHPCVSAHFIKRRDTLLPSHAYRVISCKLGRSVAQ